MLKLTATAEQREAAFGMEGRRILSNGDIVHIPVGTPHQLLIAGGTMFGPVVVTVQEARNGLSCHIAAEGPTAGAFFSWGAARARRRFRGSK